MNFPLCSHVPLPSHQALLHSLGSWRNSKRIRMDDESFVMLELQILSALSFQPILAHQKNEAQKRFKNIVKNHRSIFATSWLNMANMPKVQNPQGLVQLNWGLKNPWPNSRKFNCPLESMTDNSGLAVAIVKQNGNLFAGVLMPQGIEIADNFHAGNCIIFLAGRMVPAVYQLKKLPTTRATRNGLAMAKPTVRARRVFPAPDTPNISRLLCLPGSKGPLQTWHDNQMKISIA